MNSIVLQVMSTGSLEFGSGKAEFEKGRRVDGIRKPEVGMQDSEKKKKCLRRRAHWIRCMVDGR